MRRRASIVLTVATAGFLALGGAAYAGGTGNPPPADDRESCTTAQAGNFVALGGVCPVVDPDTVVDLDELVRLN